MFAFRLCLALGEVHPDYLLKKLTSRQLVEWQAFFEQCPFGQDLTDFQLARIASVLLNRWKKQGLPDVSPSDMLPKFHQQSTEEMMHAPRRFINR